MRIVVLICAVMLLTGAVLVIRRVELGPSVLDRVVGLDVLVSTLLAGLALYSGWTGRLDLLPIMVVLSLVGFVGSVTVARFVAAESEEEGRILTADEIARQRTRGEGHRLPVEDDLDDDLPEPGGAR